MSISSIDEFLDDHLAAALIERDPRAATAPAHLVARIVAAGEAAAGRRTAGGRPRNRVWVWLSFLR